MDKKTVDDYLNEVSYDFTGYTPSAASLNFVNFIKLVNGGVGESNKTPVVHYQLLDNIFSKYGKLAVLCHRGFAKSTLLTTYLPLYIAVFGKLDNFGVVNYILAILDSQEGGAKTMRQSLERTWNNSEFLQRYLVDTRFTDAFIELENAEGHRIGIKLVGAQMGIRGTRFNNKTGSHRPELCHQRGTVVTTDMGTHLVEEYYKVGTPRLEEGKIIKLAGLPFTETVTNEHRYWCIEGIKTRNKKYLDNKTTKSTTTFSYVNPKWIEAQNLTINNRLGNQMISNTWVGSPIDNTVEAIQPIKETIPIITSRNKKGHVISTASSTVYSLYLPMLDEDFWWLYGLWLADGHRGKNKLGFTIANTQENILGRKVEAILKKFNWGFYRTEKPGCYQLNVSNTRMSNWVKETKRGNSIKDMPSWVLKIDPKYQKQILLGYLSGDGYFDISRNQLRINSINLTVLKQLGKICERIRLPYHIRNTKRQSTEIFPNGKVCNTKHQYEIRVRDNVKDILGISIENGSNEQKEVFIKDGFIWRKVKAVVDSELTEFIPIQTPTHVYTTDFGLSHNCLIDDVLSDTDAKSPTVIANINNTIHKAAAKSMHPTKNKTVYIGTVFSQSDPLYTVIESGRWKASVYPVCERFPCTEEEFRGSWEDRFPYWAVKEMYDDAVELGRMSDFNAEMMNRVISDEDRVILDSDIVWYKRENVIKNKGLFNFYITTDFATSSSQSSDYSVISVWAYNYSGDWLWVDGICARQLMDKNVNDLFRLAQEYKPQAVGIEVSGQQGGFIPWIMDQMVTRNIYFPLASDNNNGKPGIRPTTNKMQRFNVVVPWFKAKKMFFPKEMKNEFIMRELYNELSLVTPVDFKSKHDDFCDTISMLALISAYKPSQETPKPKEEDSSPFWIDAYSESNERIESYII